MKLIAATILLVAIAVVMLGVKALFVKGGRFPSGHAHDLKNFIRSRKNKNL